MPSPPPPPKAPIAPPSVIDGTAQVNAEQALRRRRRGAASTFLTSRQGDLQSPNTLSKSLLGGGGGA